MRIQILGMGCAKCQKLEENARQAASELSMDFEIEKVKDLQQIMAFRSDGDPGPCGRRSREGGRQGPGGRRDQEIVGETIKERNMKNTIVRGIVLFFLAGLMPMSCGAANTKADESSKNAAEVENYLVTFVELGSVRCVPCKMMQPIMKDIEKEFAGQVKVVFYDVWTTEGEPFARLQDPRHPHPGFFGQGRQGIFPSRGLLSQGGIDRRSSSKKG